MDNSLNIKISSGSLMKYALPTILSMIFMNVYGLLDSMFVAIFIDTDAYSAVNIVGPFLAIALAIGTMIASGGGALVAKQLGEGEGVKARQNFSFFMLFVVLVSAFFGIVGILFREPIIYMMGSNEALYPFCEAYAVPIFVMIPFAMIAIMLQLFFVTAGKPGLGFAITIVGGVVNTALDLIFLGVMKMGVEGSAYSTAIGYILQSIIGVIYFFVARKGSLYFVKPKSDFKALGKACTNGIGDMISMLAVSVTMIATNIIMMDLGGSDAVAAAGVVLAAQSLLSAFYAGYAQGVTPIISYQYGKADYDALKKLYKITMKSVVVLSIFTFLIAFPAAKPMALLYADGVENVINMSIEGMYIFAVGFLLMGINMYASSFFVALNDGVTASILAVFRTLIFLIIPLLIFPKIWGITGVWISLPIAEVLSLLLVLFYFKKKKNVYHYA